MGRPMNIQGLSERKDLREAVGEILAIGTRLVQDCDRIAFLGRRIDKQPLHTVSASGQERKRVL